jgi:hypothetical protein
LKTGDTVLKVTASPLRHGVAGTGHFVGDLQVGRLIGVRDPQDQATTENQRLRRGMRSRQGFEPVATRDVQGNRWGIGVRHRGILA